MKWRILFLTDPIGKPSYAPRMRYFAEYMLRHGMEVEVYTEQYAPLPFAHAYPIHEIPCYSGFLDWAIKSVWSLMSDWRNRHFSKQLRHCVADKEYDMVVCTTFSTFPLRAAADIARERAIPLVVDIRDLDEQVPDMQYQAHRQWWTVPFRRWYSRVNIRRRNRVLCQADAITTISQWHVDFIRGVIGAGKAHRVHLIYNGYDPVRFYAEDIPSPTFDITYLGRIYAFQSTQLIERVVQELAIPDIRLCWHTPDHEPIDNDKAGDVIRQSSIMLVLTNPEAKGMMTTKFYEALGAEKPILCIPSDHGILAEKIVQTNAGLASSDAEEIKQFILARYHEWQQQGFTRQQVVHKEQFSRETEAARLVEIMSPLLDKPQTDEGKKKILMIGDGFGQPSYSPRLRYLAEYLHEHGYAVDVVVEYIEPIPFAHAYPIHDVHYYRDQKSANKVDWVIKNVLSLLVNDKERYMYREIERVSRGKHYDLVFSTTFHTFPITAAQRYALRHHIPLVLDIRDVVEQAPNNQEDYLAHGKDIPKSLIWLYITINRRRRNRALKQAQVITTISPWHTQFLSQFNPSVELIYNGYDERVLSPKLIKTDTFVLTYMGKYIGSPLQDAKLFFEALQSIHDIDYRVHIYCNDSGNAKLRSMAKQYGVESHFVFSGYIPVDSVAEAYHESSILLLFSNKASDKTCHGMMTTKFFEALGVEKPLLCVRSDHEDLARIIQYTQAGLAADSRDDIIRFIRDQYQTWSRDGFTHQSVDHRDEFVRGHQAECFMKLFDQLTKPTISVIVPMYNAERYLDRALQSLLDQHYPNLDIVVVDDSSTDRSRAIADSYAAKDARVRVFTKENLGQGEARNYGLEKAQGDWISFLDADDWLDADCYATLIQHATADVIQFGYKRVNDRGEVLEQKLPKTFHQFTSSCMRLYKRSFMERYRIRFRSDVYYEDVLFSLDVWSHHPRYTMCSYMGYNYRLTAQSITTVSHADEQCTTLKALVERWHHASDLSDKVLTAYTMARLYSHLRRTGKERKRRKD